MKNYEDFKAYVKNQYPMEACGYIVDDIFIPIENVADDPVNRFEMSREDSIKFVDQDYMIIHSHTMSRWHPGDDPRAPSEEDMKCQKANGVPFGIVHTDGENITEILWLGDTDILPLIGRQYVTNVYDCLRIASDYYLLNHGIIFDTYPRPLDWQSANPYFIEQHYKDEGFYDIPVSEAKTGDMLFFSIGSHLINHIGIVTGPDKFIHHLYNRISNEDSISRWNRQLTKAVRHPEVNPK